METIPQDFCLILLACFYNLTTVLFELLIKYSINQWKSFSVYTSKVNQQVQKTSRACMVGSSISFPSSSKF